jgi:hypothetical protein
MADYAGGPADTGKGTPGPGWMGNSRFTPHGKAEEYADPYSAAAATSNLPQYFAPKTSPLPGITSTPSKGTTEPGGIPTPAMANQPGPTKADAPDATHGTGPGLKQPMQDPLTKKRAPTAKPTPGSAVLG